MRYIWQHIDTIIATYNGGIPLTHFLKNYYRQHPRLGSRDRKILSEMAYCWYRCEKGVGSELAFEDKMRICLYICAHRQKQIIPFLPEGWDAGIEDVAQRLALVTQKGIQFDQERLFPFGTALSEGMERIAWLRSMLTQPDLFIRIRKNKPELLQVLRENSIPFQEVNDICIALPNTSAIDKLLPEYCYVIQDASSQQTGTYFNPSKDEAWYDCCSGAGGKSLLLKDIEPQIHLTVSDKRETILRNLKDRFRLYRHDMPTAHVLDAANKDELQQRLGSSRFDTIICDVPCSGSGTWARTPEQLYFFEKDIVPQISSLQQQIATNVAAYLKDGGRLLYITCSVFRQENEAVVTYLAENTGLKLMEQHLINGIGIRADSMFVTVLER